VQQQAAVLNSPAVQAVINTPTTAAPLTSSVYDPAAVQAARAYRVAVLKYGANDSRTTAFIKHLSTFPSWSDVLAYVSGIGFDAAAEESIRQTLPAEGT
jgi:hypothetical protein